MRIVGRSSLLVPTVLALGTLCVVAAQGLTARRTIERLPAADGAEGSHGPTVGDPLRLVVLGDSVAAGVGITHHDATLAGRLAVLLAGDRGVRRSVIAQSGLTAAGVTVLVGGHPELSSADVVVVSVGVNDAKALHSTARWRDELTTLLDAVTESAPNARVVLLGVPDLALFNRLPRPLRSVLGVRSRALDKAGRGVVSRYPRVHHLRLLKPVPIDGAFAADGFHPSEAMHAEFARGVHSLLARTDNN
jgi:lysophospholipase L1-like esterase